MLDKFAYSVEEVAALSSLSPAKVRKDIRDGKLQSIRKGTRRIVLADALRRYLTADDPATRGATCKVDPGKLQTTLGMQGANAPRSNPREENAPVNTL